MQEQQRLKPKEDKESDEKHGSQGVRGFLSSSSRASCVKHGVAESIICICRYAYIDIYIYVYMYLCIFRDVDVYESTSHEVGLGI